MNWDIRKLVLTQSCGSSILCEFFFFFISVYVCLWTHKDVVQNRENIQSLTSVNCLFPQTSHCYLQSFWVKKIANSFLISSLSVFPAVQGRFPDVHVTD